MATNKNIPPPAAFVDPATGFLTRQANNFLNAITSSSNEAAAGDVATPAGSGLQGGGAVADGVTLSIAVNGVTFTMIQQIPACSVVGRFQGTTGNVSAVQAVQNRTVLQRQGNQLVFAPSVDVPAVVCDSFRIDQSPTAEAVVCTHTIVISVDGTDYKVPCVAA
jgi:hypothetical protein